MVRWLASISTCSWVRGDDTNHCMNTSASAKPNSLAVEFVWRSRSRQRSRGKCRPILVATNSLNCDNRLSGRLSFIPCLTCLPKRFPACLCHVSRQGRLQHPPFIERKKLVEVADQNQAVFQLCHTVNAVSYTHLRAHETR